MRRYSDASFTITAENARFTTATEIHVTFAQAFHRIANNVRMVIPWLIRTIGMVTISVTIRQRTFYPSNILRKYRKTKKSR